MLEALLTCLRATYTHTQEGGDFAVVYQNQRLYLLFEWSDGYEDWKNNFSFASTCVNPQSPKEERWYCHRGFLRVWQGMRWQVISEVDWYVRRYVIREMVCVGYSHGAALSLLATQEMYAMCQESQVKVTGYGFGCPRVVKGKLPPAVRESLKSFTSVRNRHDIVTYLPPRIFGFAHVGLVEIGKSGQYNMVEAHRAENYIASLQDMEPTSPLASRTHIAFAYGR